MVRDHEGQEHPVELLARGPFQLLHPAPSWRGPLPAGVLGGSWSAYYYNGYIYSSDIQKGLDVVAIDDKRTDKAESVQLDQLNVQSQPEYGSHPGKGQGKAKGRG